MTNIAKSIIGKIKKEGIKPTPKWVFMFKNSFIWGLFGLSVLFGSIAISIIFFQFRDADFDLYNQINDGIVEFVLLALPYFWILLMVGFLLLAHHYLRHTKTGYKYNVFLIFGLSLFVSLILGSALYAGGFSEKLEELFQEIPHYEKLQLGKRMLWQNPESGRLAGTIIQIEDDKVLILEDIKKQSWWVDIEGAKKRQNLILIQGLQIRIAGEVINEGRFKAKMIAPWKRGGKRRMKKPINQNTPPPPPKFE